MDIVKAINQAKLPKDQLIVVASGIMNALGIRESDDIDLVITPELYKRLKNTPGWKEIEKHGYNVLMNGPFEAGLSWDNDDEIPNLDYLLKDAVYIKDVPFASLEKVRTWKEKMGREKDKKDLVLIDNYLDNKKEN